MSKQNKTSKSKPSSAQEFNRKLLAVVLMFAGLFMIIGGIYSVSDSDYKWYKSFLAKTEDHLAQVLDGDYDPAIVLQYNDYIEKYTKKIADRKTTSTVFTVGGVCTAAAGGVVMVTGKKKED